MAKKKTGKKAAQTDRPSGAPASVVPASQPVKTASASATEISTKPASIAGPVTRESRPPAPSSVVPAEPPPVVKVPAPDSAPRLQAAPPRDPASTAPVVKDIDEDGEAKASTSEPPPPAAKATPAPAEIAEKKTSEPPPPATPKPASVPPPAASAPVPSVDAAPAEKSAEPTVAKADAEETAPVSARGQGSTDDPAPPSKPAEASAATVPANTHDEGDAPPSSRAPDSGGEDKISGKALLDDRLVPKSSGTVKKKKKKDKDGPKSTKAEHRESEPPDSPRSVTLDAHDDGHDDFFDQPDEKVRQKHYVGEGVDAFEDDEPRFRPLTADDVVRRNKLRRVVTIVVGTAAAACLLAGVKLSMGTKHADPPPLDRSQVVIAAPPVPKPQIAIDEPKPSAVDTATAPAPSASGAASAAPAASASAAPALSASAAPATSGAPVDAEEYKKMAKNALKALESGNNKVAVERSSAAVDADPADATGYLYWGTALMNMGKLADAKKVFQSCVEKATKGPKSDCRQFR